MKKFVALMMVLSVWASFHPTMVSYAAERGASAQAFEHASDQSIFNRATDWFATVGKSGVEKQAILAERKAKRAARRLEKEARKAGKETKKQAEGLKEKAKKHKLPW